MPISLRGGKTLQPGKISFIDAGSRSKGGSDAMKMFPEEDDEILILYVTHCDPCNSSLTNCYF